MSVTVQKIKRLTSKRDQKKLNSMYLLDKAHHKVFVDEHEDPFIHTKQEDQSESENLKEKKRKQHFALLVVIF